MSNKKGLPPAVLAALGLTACVDGCEPADIPLVGRLFDEGSSRPVDDDTDGPGADPDDVSPPPVHPCLTPVLAPRPPPIGPCLSPPRPPPRVGPCLSRVPVKPPPRVGPCLKIAMPQPPPPAPVGPCLEAPMIVNPAPVGPCLRVSRPVPPQPPPPTGDQSGSIQTKPVDFVAELQREGTLPADILERLKS